jgi:Predicted membrane protein
LAETSEDIGKVFLDVLIGNVVYALEIIITIIILAIIAITLFSLLKATISSLRKREEQVRLRINEIVSRLLRGMLISLDILVAADILKTILVPSITELAVLVIIVVVRVLLTFFIIKRNRKTRETIEVIFILFKSRMIFRNVFQWLNQYNVEKCLGKISCCRYNRK